MPSAEVKKPHTRGGATFKKAASAPKKEPERPKSRLLLKEAPGKPPGKPPKASSASERQPAQEKLRGPPRLAGRAGQGPGEPVATAESQRRPSPLGSVDCPGDGPEPAHNGPESPQPFRHLEAGSPLKWVGPPSPLVKTPKSDQSINLELSPTDLQPRLSHGPDAEDAGGSSEEKTLEMMSPASAGRTPSPPHSPVEDVAMEEEEGEGPVALANPWRPDGPLPGPRASQDNSSSSQEKPPSCLSPSLFREDLHDVSPTLTTPSLPAEVGSPHSTEVDESLSISFEQLLPPVSEFPQEEGEGMQAGGLTPDPEPALGKSGMSLPILSCHPQRLDGRALPRSGRRSDSPHDVDLCLVSPCEFEHPKSDRVSPRDASNSSDFSQELAKPPSHRKGPRARRSHPLLDETPPTSFSESLPTLSDSDVPPAMEECPSLTADGGLDSDDDPESLAQARDPLPSVLKDPCPLPAQPGICMVDPEREGPAKAKRAPSRGASAPPKAEDLRAAGPHARGKPSSASLGERARLSAPGRSEPPNSRASGDNRLAFAQRSASARPLLGAGGGGGGGRVTPAGARPVLPRGPVYLELAYLPGSASAQKVDEEFFRCLRSQCYVISGEDHLKESVLRAILDALLAGKQHWAHDSQVTLIPTFDSLVMHEWYTETLSRQQALGVTVLGSNSTVAMQDETFPACKVEF